MRGAHELNRPRPVLTSASITGLIQALITICAFLGYTSTAGGLSAEQQSLVGVIVGAVTLGGNIVHGLHAQKQVTPIDSPVASDGTPLVKATNS